MEENASKLEKFLSSRYFVALCVVLVGLIAFILGRISGVQRVREPVRVYNSLPATINTSPPNPSPKLGERSPTPSEFGEVKGASLNSEEQVVASKNGTKYHYPWCGGAKQIAEKNKIAFNSIEEARASGYLPAANCKGLK